jgi:hypothetical protein
MHEILEVELLGNAAAASLARYLTERVDLNAKVGGSRVEVETNSGSLPALLSALEEWGQRSAESSLCLRLDGRSYVLESPTTANTVPATT